MLIKAKDLTGYTLQSRDGEIGKVKNFYFDDRHWALRYLIADTGNWLEDRRVLLSPYSLLSVNMDKKQVAVDLTKKQIEDSPSLYIDKPVSQQFETDFYGYYGWPLYWGGAYAWGNYPFLIRDPEKRQATNIGGKAWNPHLRSALEVNGYHIEGLDGEIGHIKDYIVDDETWAIQYIVIDTHNWIPGKTVLIAPRWIKNVSWDDSKIIVDLTCDAIKGSPEYTETALLTRAYETELHGHYNRVEYWIEE